ncbi:hypothetical protein AS590_29380 [Prescottella equi]|uniref:DUF7144 family membrane protein n=1 Tax=Rhodococcus qingshengii TaxID=334542 RepID=UPI0002B7C3F4|nr:hypothetical protein [Rhodococcus qingshengii]EME19454.1 hypothetical protein G418_17405 [Rhodococcus qingshengii BKS 20-40]KLN70262.1 membrane protein [Rhodococcus erythropolis]MYV28691.1 hypothetical protein [Rhodococcus erythropolis]OCC20029.1 hypothetical protein AS590_29380 [Prescottella equi]
MSDTTSVKQGFAVGTSIGAAVILVTVGIVQFFQGLAAVAENEVFVVGIDYVYQFDLTTWGWIHLVLGALVALVGLALFTGAAWARVSAVVICAISIIANFLWLPYYPWWSTLIIALNIVVIWAVSTWKPTQTTNATAHAPSTPTRSA